MCRWFPVAVLHEDHPVSKLWFPWIAAFSASWIEHRVCLVQAISVVGPSWAFTEITVGDRHDRVGEDSDEDLDTTKTLLVRLFFNLRHLSS